MFFLMRRVFQLRNGVLSAGLATICLFVALPAYAQGDSSIAQGFQTKDASITAAALVSVVKNDPKSVELSNVTNLGRLAGVVSNKSLIDLSDSSNSVQVVMSGLTLALVSDLNGTVSNGDKITSSPIEGVGMKATQSGMVVGTAQGNLAGVQTEPRTLVSRAGQKKLVHIGLLPVQVGTDYYSVTEKKAPFVPGFLQELANNVTGRNVSAVRVLVAALILLLLLVCVTVLLYSAVHSSIISIGRNPLAIGAVRKSLYEVGLTVIAILLFTVLIVYLVLTV